MLTPCAQACFDVTAVTCHSCNLYSFNKQTLTGFQLREVCHERVIVLTTHAMEEADALGDRLGIMHDGKIQVRFSLSLSLSCYSFILSVSFHPRSVAVLLSLPDFCVFFASQSRTVLWLLCLS